MLIAFPPEVRAEIQKLVVPVESVDGAGGAMSSAITASVAMHKITQLLVALGRRAEAVQSGIGFDAKETDEIIASIQNLHLFER